jgi:hypothetical protein
MADQPSKMATVEALAAGQAALWLSESLILALVDRKILDKDRVLEAVDIVIAAKQALVAEGGNEEIERAALGLLASISTSIASVNPSGDRRRGGGSPRRRRVRNRPA